MTTVFIGGSRRLARLNEQIRAKLAEIADRRLRILIGDANGADRAVQSQLAEWGYSNVTVYFVGSKPRNNEGGWPLLKVSAPSRSKGSEYYAAKDKAMAQEADCGLMIWDGESRGTLSNVRNLIREEKPVAVYVSKQRRFVNVLIASDLRSLGADAEDGTTKVGNEQPELPLGIPMKTPRKRRHRTA